MYSCISIHMQTVILVCNITFQGVVDWVLFNSAMVSEIACKSLVSMPVTSSNTAHIRVHVHRSTLSQIQYTYGKYCNSRRQYCDLTHTCATSTVAHVQQIL